MLIELCAATGYNLYNMVKADKLSKEAEKTTVKALNKRSDAEHELWKQKRLTDESLKKLVNRKKGIISISIKEFIDLYEKILAIEFNESDGIKQLEGSKNLSASVREMSTMVELSRQTLTEKQNAAAFIMGYMFGGVIGGVTNTIKKEAEVNLASAKMLNKEARLVASQAETGIVVLEAIYNAAERISKLLTQLNILFRKSIETTSFIIEKNGVNRTNYSREEKDYIMVCLNLADVIKKVIDAPLLDREGAIAQKAAESIQLGEDCIERIKSIINER